MQIFCQTENSVYLYSHATKKERVTRLRVVFGENFEACYAIAELSKMTKEKDEIRVLYVDDEIVNLQGFKANYRREYDVFTAVSAAEARKILSENEIHVLITDQKMPEELGTELLEEVVKDYPEQERIMLTAYADSQAILDAFQKGNIYRYVMKPYDPEALKTIIDEAFRLYTLKRVKDRLFEEWKKNNDEMNKLGGSNLI